MIEILEHATILSRFGAPAQGASAWGEGQNAGNQEPGDRRRSDLQVFSREIPVSADRAVR
jgi:hypothetical protein